jgi:hypothetical protein
VIIDPDWIFCFLSEDHDHDLESIVKGKTWQRTRLENKESVTAAIDQSMATLAAS